MSRLTERFGQNATTKEPCYIPAGIGKQEGNPLNEIVNKLGRLEDLADEGRLIELPCKVGEEVWTIDKDFGIQLVEYHVAYRIVFDMWKGYAFAKTKAEAEAKLAELKGLWR